MSGHLKNNDLKVPISINVTNLLNDNIIQFIFVNNATKVICILNKAELKHSIQLLRCEYM
jgi:hypothetical protein